MLYILMRIKVNKKNGADNKSGFYSRLSEKKSIFAGRNQTFIRMKHRISCLVKQTAWHRLLGLCLLYCLVFTPAGICAQNGITVYSDTVSVLEDAEDDDAWDSSIPVGNGTFIPDVDFDEEGMLGLLAGILGVTGFALVIIIILAFLVPVLVMILIVSLIYRSGRMKRQHIEHTATDPENGEVNEDIKNRLLRQTAIRYACGGAGLIAIEYVVQLTFLLYVAGITLLCLAASNWLTTLVGKK